MIQYKELRADRQEYYMEGQITLIDIKNAIKALNTLLDVTIKKIKVYGNMSAAFGTEWHDIVLTQSNKNFTFYDVCEIIKQPIEGANIEMVKVEYEEAV